MKIEFFPTSFRLVNYHFLILELCSYCLHNYRIQLFLHDTDINQMSIFPVIGYAD